MATKRIEDYTAASTIDGTNDLLLEYQASSGVYKSINRSVFLGVTAQPVDISTTQTLTNKTLTSPAISGPTLSGTVLGTYTLGGTPTFPSSVATLTGIQTLTNKTITSPAITGGTISNAAITVDSISGFSTATIVTVGGVQLNNGTINTSNAVVTATITDGAVTPAKLLAGTGTGWAWQSWAPSYTNFTLGNATVNAKYIQTGKTVSFYIRVILGSTSSMGTNPTFTLPVTATDFASNDVIGSGTFNNSGTGYFGAGLLNSTTVCRLIAIDTSTAAGALLNITASVPFVWAAGSFFQITGTYESA